MVINPLFAITVVILSVGGCVDYSLLHDPQVCMLHVTLGFYFL